MPEQEFKKYPVYGPFEVVIHNKPDDCWLSFLGKVYNVTPLIKHNRNKQCVKPLIAFAGKDVSHWFDQRTGEIQHYIHPVTGVEVPYCPHGAIPDVSCEVPSTLWKPLSGPPWWKDEKYQIGFLTKCVRPLRIVSNVLCKEVTINVCCEDTIDRIKERYSIYNKELECYTWKYGGKVLDMNKTLSENGIIDDRNRLADLGIPKSSYIPCLFIYYNDDFRHFEDDSDLD